MRTFVRFSALALLLGCAFPSISYAQDEASSSESQSFDEQFAVEERDEGEVMSLEDAQDMLRMLPSYKDAVTGTVKEEVSQDYYDIYGRQLAYRESAKDLRASLEARRVNFERPRTETIERFRETQEKLFQAETAAYQAKLKKKEMEAAAKMKTEAAPEKEIEEAPQVEKTASVDEDLQTQEDIGLKEEDVPANGGKKKVITSEDAPDFDPANL